MIDNGINAAVTSLMNKDDVVLYKQLAGYTDQYPIAPHEFAAPGATVAAADQVAGTMEGAITIGKRILNRWNKTLYDLVCTEKDPSARETVLGALSSPVALATAITGILIGTFSVAPAIATIVGVLFGKLLLPAAGEEICAVWKENIA